VRSAWCDRDEIVGHKLCGEGHFQLHVLLGEGCLELVGFEELDEEDLGGKHGVAVADAVAGTLRKKKALKLSQAQGQLLLLLTDPNGM
jgi:hypothetical protein